MKLTTTPVDHTRIKLNQVVGAIIDNKPDDVIVETACAAIRHIPKQRKIRLLLATIQAADQWATEHSGMPRRFPDFVPTF